MNDASAAAEHGRNLAAAAGLGPRMRLPWWLGLVLGLVLLALAGACTSGDPVGRTVAPPSAGTPSAAPPGPASTPPGAADVNCDHSIATLNTPTPGTRVVLGVAALPAGLLEAVPADGRFWSKRGLEVLAGAVVEISVAPEAAGHAWIGWGSPGEPRTAQSVNGCSMLGCAVDCGWLAFAGGYWVDAPACVPIVVRSQGREARARVAVGVACD